MLYLSRPLPRTCAAATWHCAPAHRYPPRLACAIVRLCQRRTLLFGWDRCIDRLGWQESVGEKFRSDINVILIAPKGMGPSVRHKHEAF